MQIIIIVYQPVVTLAKREGGCFLFYRQKWRSMDDVKNKRSNYYYWQVTLFSGGWDCRRRKSVIKGKFVFRSE